MNALQVNSATGFLEQNSRNAFDSDKKIKLLSMAQEFVDREEYPDLNFICRKLGINVVTFWRHYDSDEVFREAYEEIDSQIENVLNRNLIANAKKANGVGAAAFWLKNRMSKRWSDNPGHNQIIVDLSTIKKALDVNSGFIDAEIVEKPAITSTPLEINTNSNSKDVKHGSPSENR